MIKSSVPSSAPKPASTAPKPKPKPTPTRGWRPFALALLVLGAALSILQGCDKPPQASSQQVRAAGKDGRCIAECTESMKGGCYSHTDKTYGVDTRVGGGCVEAIAEARKATEPDCNTPIGVDCVEVSLADYFNHTGQKP